VNTEIKVKKLNGKTTKIYHYNVIHKKNEDILTTNLNRMLFNNIIL